MRDNRTENIRKYEELFPHKPHISHIPYNFVYFQRTVGPLFFCRFLAKNGLGPKYYY